MLITCSVYHLCIFANDYGAFCKLVLTFYWVFGQACFGMNLGRIDLEPVKETLEFSASECASLDKKRFMLYVTFPVGDTRAPEVFIKVLCGPLILTLPN